LEYWKDGMWVEYLKPIIAVVASAFTPLEIIPRSVSSRNDWNF